MLRQTGPTIYLRAARWQVRGSSPQKALCEVHEGNREELM
jgi:hypothetical protein